MENNTFLMGLSSHIQKSSNVKPPNQLKMSDLSLWLAQRKRFKKACASLESRGVPETLLVYTVRRSVPSYPGSGFEFEDRSWRNEGGR